MRGEYNYRATFTIDSTVMDQQHQRYHHRQLHNDLFESVPDDALIRIFSYVPLQHRARLLGVCRRFRCIISGTPTLLWRPLCQQRFGCELHSSGASCCPSDWQQHLIGLVSFDRQSRTRTESEDHDSVYYSKPALQQYHAIRTMAARTALTAHGSSCAPFHRRR